MLRRALKEVSKIKALVTLLMCLIFLRLMEGLLITHLSNFKNNTQAIKEKVPTRMRPLAKLKNL